MFMAAGDVSSMEFLTLDQAATFEGGFDERIFLDRIDERQKCSYCRKVLRVPRQRKCGHLFCSSCLQSLCRSAVRTGEPAIYCTSCIIQEQVDEDSVITSNDESTKDFATTRALASKKVRCAQQACTYQATLKEYQENHELSCPYATTDCPNSCGVNLHISKLRAHMEETCAERRVVCSYCNKEFPFREEEQHNAICPNRPVTCDLCGQGNFLREQLRVHLAEKCKYARCTLGCSKPIEKLKLVGHYADEKLLNDHLMFVGHKFEEVHLIIKQASESVRGMTPVGAGLAPLAIDSQTPLELLERLNEEVHVLDSLSAVYKVEFEKVIEAQNQHKLRLDTMVETQVEMQSRMLRLEQAIQLRDVQLMERDLRIQALEEVSYDGTLIWRIDDFTERRGKAQTGEMTSFYSPAFYTSPCGYKMCARLYLNGDGIGKNTHISFFFVVMRGRYDGLLRWPFQQKVTMMLLDFNNQHHIMDAFRPDANSASFHKPKNEMNVASGCPLFMPLTALQDKITSHVRDNVAYFKIIVDCSDIQY